MLLGVFLYIKKDRQLRRPFSMIVKISNLLYQQTFTYTVIVISERLLVSQFTFHP